MSRIHDIPGTLSQVQYIGSVTAGGSFTGFVFKAPYDAKVAIKGVVSATAASNSSDYATLTFTNGGTTGTGTTSFGSFGTNTTALAANTVTSLVSATDIDEGEVLKLVIAQEGSGVGLTNLSLIFDYQPR